MTYRSVLVEIWSCDEAVEVRGRADVGEDVGVVDPDEEVGNSMIFDLRCRT